MSQYGAQGSVNQLTGAVIPIVASAAPFWFPGLIWINSSGGYAVNEWNGSAWVLAGTRYLALLTADPVAGGVVNISDPGFLEMTTPGYSRQLVTFGQTAAAYPTTTSNLGLITFGPLASTMTLPVQWVALVTGAAGTTGLFLFSWYLPASLEIQASQSIQISPGTLILDQA